MEQRSPAPAEVARTAWDRMVSIDRQVLRFLSSHSLTLLRLSLGVVFVWFGALKVFGVTPVTELVSSVVYWVDPGWFVPVLGALEVIVGVGLLFSIGMRIVLFLFVAQLIGTFLVLIIRPDIAFQNGNPLVLTTEGELVIKNLVLISGGLAVGARLRALPPWTPPDVSSSTDDHPPPIR
ncbi:MAG: DoxX family membrane protein [Actinomycetota bacterium]